MLQLGSTHGGTASSEATALHRIGSEWQEGAPVELDESLNADQVVQCFLLPVDSFSRDLHANQRSEGDDTVLALVGHALVGHASGWKPLPRAAAETSLLGEPSGPLVAHPRRSESTMIPPTYQGSLETPEPLHAPGRYERLSEKGEHAPG